ncbi:MAG: ion transporter [Phycisphaerales bacterium JB039]
MPAWRYKLHEVIFEADTTLGKAFDIALLVAIVLSVLAVTLETVEPIRQAMGPELRAAEWVFTILFTIEYILRLTCVRRPVRYATSFFGVVDLLAVVPTYLTLFGIGAQSLVVIRALRLLRIFRVFKLVRYLDSAGTLMAALRASFPKVIVFMLAVVVLVLIMGSMMYLIEGGPDSQFSSIPRSVYWAIVTMTTVGFGDITPQTIGGQILASAIMIIGYSIIAVPTGIVISETVTAMRKREVTTQHCPSCQREGHAADAAYCKFCGEKL